MATLKALPGLIREANPRRERKREGWPPPFLLSHGEMATSILLNFLQGPSPSPLSFLKGMGRWPPQCFLFFFKGWGDGHPPS